LARSFFLSPALGFGVQPRLFISSALLRLDFSELTFFFCGALLSLRFFCGTPARFLRFSLRRFLSFALCFDLSGNPACFFLFSQPLLFIGAQSCGILFLRTKPCGFGFGALASLSFKAQAFLFSTTSRFFLSQLARSRFFSL
jgi:hypothetical protein